MLTSMLHVYRAAEMGTGDSKRHCCKSCRLQTLGDALEAFPWELQGGSTNSYEGSHLVVGYPYCSRDINPRNIVMESHAANIARDADHALFLKVASMLVSAKQLEHAGEDLSRYLHKKGSPGRRALYFEDLVRSPGRVVACYILVDSHLFQRCNLAHCHVGMLTCICI